MDHHFSHALTFLIRCSFFFLLFLWCCGENSCHRRRSEKYGGGGQHGNSTTSVQQHTIEESCELKTQKEIQQTKRNKNWTKRFVIHGKKRASLLTYTIKASFAKRKCRSLFLGGQKVERACFRSVLWVSWGWVWLSGVPQQGTLLSWAQTVWHQKVLEINQVILHGC